MVSQLPQHTDNMEVWERKKQKKEFGISSGSAGWKFVKGSWILRTQKDQCSMWSAQLPDTADSQAWGTAVVMGPMARWPLWDQLLLDFLLAFSRLVLTGEVYCTEVMSLARPDEFVSAGVHCSRLWFLSNGCGVLQ